MACCGGTRLSCGLLVSHLLLLTLSCMAVGWTWFYWGYEPMYPLGDEVPQAPVTTPAPTTTTTESNSYQRYNYDSVDPDPATSKWLSDMRARADRYNDPRLYSVMTFSVTAVFSAAIVICALARGSVFKSTAGLYLSACVSVLHIYSLITYLAIPSIVQSVEAFWQEVGVWPLCLHAAVILYTCLQVIVSGVELRHTKSGWPTVNLMSLFTLETPFVLARLVIASLTVTVVFHSPIVNGLVTTACDGYYDDNCAHNRFPDLLFYPVAVVVLVNLASSVEAGLSVWFGQPQRKLIGTLALLTGLGCAFAAFVTSPIFCLKYLNGRVWPEAMMWCVVSCILSLVHGGFSLFASFISTPPAFIAKAKELFQNMDACESSSFHSLFPNSFVEQCKEPKNKQFPGGTHQLQVAFSICILVASLLNMILLGISVLHCCGGKWGATLLFAYNCVYFTRSLDVVLAINFKEHAPVKTYKATVLVYLEVAVVLAGAIGGYIDTWPATTPVAATFTILMCCIMQVMKYKRMAAMKGTPVQVKEGDDTAKLTENDEQASQDPCTA